MRILVIRTSAMGDVALTTPVLMGMKKQYPDIELIFLTRTAFKPFFSSIEGLNLFFPDFKKRHKGFLGLISLFRDISKKGKIDYVIDLHDVVRSKMLRFLFRLSGVPASVIDKGRREKRAVIKREISIQLKHSVERYCDVFGKAGFPVTPAEGPWIIPTAASLLKVSSMTGPPDQINIGVAPYAKHKLKMWPEENMIQLLKLISEKQIANFWLFGGKEDSEKLKSFQLRIPGSFNLAGKLSLEEELALMSRLNFMIAMDSSNMHMAALVGTKVISIWGGTDPITGFGAWSQPEDYSMKIPFDELDCHPCTIFGKGECRRGDLACMKWQTPEIVFEKIMKLNLIF
ncbi:MAG TPA: glycosyltransferase family 9 protein [Bacteroidales bacterium]